MDGSSVVMGRVLLPAIALLAIGCAHEVPGWKVVSSDHFRIYTDLPARKYEDVAERLEEVQAGLASSFFDAATIPPLEVFLFSESEFHELMGPIGGFFMGRAGKQGVLVVYDGWDPHFLDTTAAHELAHGFINATFRTCPIWFNEGFAEYAESIVIRDEKVWFGSLAASAAVEASQGRLVPVAELFSARWDEFHGAWERRHYATAWALLHYLWHGENKALRGRFDRFGAVLGQLARKPNGSAHAWRAVYPEIPVPELDGRLRDHLNTVTSKPGSTLVGFRLVRPARAQPKVEPADLAHVDGVRAELRKLRRPDKL